MLTFKKHLTIKQVNEEYTYIGNCRDAFDCDANYMMQVVQQDDLSYSEDTYFHNPELKISKDQFIKLVGINYKFLNDPTTFYGYNSDENIVFVYDPKKDIHYFFGRG